MTVLLTGAAGFIGTAVAERLVRAGRRPIAMVRRAVPPRSRLSQLAERGRITIVTGDLSREALGFDDRTRRMLAATVTQVVHCAAHYRLSASPGEVDVNVEGTRRLLETVSRWPLVAFHHVSSITAAGVVEGQVPEAALPRPARVRNAYEASKWAGEAIVAGFLDRFPVRIYRPGIVIGDSVDGATSKFDGPYPAFHLAHPLLPVVIGGPADNPFPLVTVDLVADVLCAGVALPPAAGAADYITVIDTGRPTLREFAAEMAIRLLGHRRIVAVPGASLRLAARLPGFARIAGIEREALDYMGLGWRFRTEALERLCDRSGLNPRRIEGAYDAIAGFYALQTGGAFYPRDAAGTMAPAAHPRTGTRL